MFLKQEGHFPTGYMCRENIKSIKEKITKRKEQTSKSYLDKRVLRNIPERWSVGGDGPQRSSRWIERNFVASKFVRHCRVPFWSPDSHGTVKAPRSPAIKICWNVFSPAVSDLIWARTFLHTLLHTLETLSPEHRRGASVQGKGLVLL